MIRDAQRLKILGKQVFAFLFDYKRDELLELSDTIEFSSIYHRK